MNVKITIALLPLLLITACSDTTRITILESQLNGERETLINLRAENAQLETSNAVQDVQMVTLQAENDERVHDLSEATKQVANLQTQLTDLQSQLDKKKITYIPPKPIQQKTNYDDQLVKLYDRRDSFIKQNKEVVKQYNDASKPTLQGAKVFGHRSPSAKELALMDVKRIESTKQEETRKNLYQQLIDNKTILANINKQIADLEAKKAQNL